MTAQIVNQRAEDAEEVHAAVGFEALVFNRDHCLAQHRRKVVVVHQYAPLERKRADHTALPVVEFGGRRGTIFFQIGNLRQICRVNQRHARQRAGDDSQNQQADQRKASGQLATRRR